MNGEKSPMNADDLQWERELIGRIMETSLAGIMVINRDGRISYANAQAGRVLGVARDRISQRSYNAPEWAMTDHEGRTVPEAELPFRRVMDTEQRVRDARLAIK